MKRTVPMIITAVSGFVLIVAYFFPLTQSWGDQVAIWFDVLAAIAFVLGGGNLLKVHLKRISDQAAGWGFSAVALVAFLATLTIGLLKVGVTPQPNQEHYGESWVALSREDMPVQASVPGTLPDIKELLPLSVRGQLQEVENDQGQPMLVFIGWMLEEQRAQLLEYALDASWRDSVNALFTATAAPEILKGRVRYYGEQQMLSFSGVMNQEDLSALVQLGNEATALGRNSEAFEAAVERLYEQSNLEHAIALHELPNGVEIPEALAGTVRYDANARELICRGPLSGPQRDALLAIWPEGVELDEAARSALTSSLAEAGSLNEQQLEMLRQFALTAPTMGERDFLLFKELLNVGPLNPGQRDVLLDGYRAQLEWSAAVGRLLLASHVIKYPWAGSYRERGMPFGWLYEYAFKPLTATMFSMLAFYVASAAFRAFRAKNFEAVLLLGTAFIILLGRTYAGVALSDLFPDWLSFLRIENLTLWIMKVVNTAGNRAIMIGIALGVVSTSLKVLLGIDRSYLGSGE
jgi:hypothetical protein